MTGAAAHQSQIPRAGSTGFQRVHVTLIKLPKGAFALNSSRLPEDRDELVDIRDVSVNKDLPKEERLADFVKQIKNPYRFRCGDFVINAFFASGGITIEECLKGILR